MAVWRQRALRAAGLIAAFLLGVIVAGPAAFPQKADSTDIFEQLDLLMEVFERIRADYVEPVDDKKVLQGAIQGMLQSLDPHSSYLPPKSYDSLQFQMEGEYGGLGLEVTMEKGVVVVVSPIRGTPGERAGLKAGDYITHIDGKPVLGLTLDEAVEKMRGPVGTTVRLTVVRRGEEEPFEVTIQREKIVVPSVEARIERGRIGYIAVASFNEQTAKGIARAIKEFRAAHKRDLAGIVLDLRNNPGGLLDQAVAVADQFLERGEIVSVRGRHERDNERFQASPGDLAEGLPVIVLVNAGSASASEIVAGALQDHRRAVVLGEQTFGKGTVQHILPLGPGRGALRLTTARYYTPSGRSIQELGVTPDIPVLAPAKGRRFKPARERDLEGHLHNDQLPDAAQSGAAPESDGVAEEGAHVVDAPEMLERDVQLEYALDLIEGVAEAVAGRQTAALAPAAPAHK